MGEKNEKEWNKVEKNWKMENWNWLRQYIKDTDWLCWEFCNEWVDWNRDLELIFVFIQHFINWWRVLGGYNKKKARTESYVMDGMEWTWKH